MKKDKNPAEEMSEKKRLQDLVWDGLFNSLENKPVDNKNPNPSKKEKKDKKATEDKEKPEDSRRSEWAPALPIKGTAISERGCLFEQFELSVKVG